MLRWPTLGLAGLLLWPLASAFVVVGVDAAQAQPAGSRSVPAEPSGETLFARKILPVLKAKCFGCHGDEPKLRGGLDMRSRAALLRGGDTGPALVPGNAVASLLYQAVRRTGELKMPPKDEARLSAEEVEAVRRWVDAG